MKTKKIISPSALKALCHKLRSQHKKIVFTNGAFDILHLGHVTYLQKAKTFGDVLIIGVNSDSSVRRYKSPNRPINPQADRMAVLAALECVDYVVLFNEPTPLNLIMSLRPHVLAKGADYKKNQIAGAPEVESWGGKVKLVKLVPGRSTTRVIEKMKGSA